MELLFLLRNSLPHPVQDGSRIYNLTGSAPALLLAIQQKPFVAVEKDEAEAEVLKNDIHFFAALLSADSASFLPDPNGPGVAGERAELLLKLGEGRSIVTSSMNLVSPLWDVTALQEHMVRVKAGGSIARSDLEESLVRLGYRGVPMVADKGEFSQRGWILDIYPATYGNPLRIEFFGDVVERMQEFDVGTQRSSDAIDEVLIMPACDAGSQVPLADVVPESRFFCLYSPPEKEGLPEHTVFLSRYSFAGEGEEGAETTLPATQRDAGALSLAGHGVLPEERKGVEELPEKIRRLGERNKVIMVASSSGQAERLRNVFADHDMTVPVMGVQELRDFPGNVSITLGELSSGLFLPGIVILTERELFGRRVAHRPLKKSRLANLLTSVDDISPGDYVVHRDHGIGKFSGVVRETMDGTDLELMLIEYQGGRVYIPLENIQNISKYRSEEGFLPKLDELGGRTWQRKKARVKKRIGEMASKLLALYADRQIARGFTFSRDTELHREFDSFFAYEETPDQLKAIQDIKTDMESDRPMDRLICGDVGYGKTEVAMRAAFKAVYDNKQVAVLVPTTILAEQHCRTFRERFSGFPVTVDFLSRFKTGKQTRQTLRAISGGETDIVIGTHSLLSKKAIFHRLGLLVVDEEHRFGVGQKERIKELSRGVDVLSLSATPIPRTLHMALSGIRDVSIIETPPEERLSVKSVVTVFNNSLIRDSIQMELQRNGQVFFVHNRISDIYRIAGRILELVPQAQVGVAHGQMPERELEAVMHRFFEGEINVLVSTAIVGSGLDIPRANTIIINMADRMGLADLYQLRGRVGRGNTKGYAYFLAPPEAGLTIEAKKRLQAIQEMSYLGAGFRLALRDLEIRGAGDIFGPEQSGHIHEVGFDLYIEMLEKAVAELKGQIQEEEPDPVIEVRVSACIPEDYIRDVALRISFYRKITALKTEDELKKLVSELRDRFGMLPHEVLSLLDVVRVKMRARTMSIRKIQDAHGKIRVLFSENTPVEPSHIFQLRSEARRDIITFLPEGFELDLRSIQREKVIGEVHSILTELEERMQPGEDTGHRI